MSKLYDRLQQIAKEEGEKGRLLASTKLEIYPDGHGSVYLTWMNLSGKERESELFEFKDLSDLLLGLAKLSIKEKYENTQIV